MNISVLKKISLSELVGLNRLTPSLAAWILSIIPIPLRESPEEYQHLEENIDQIISSSPLLKVDLNIPSRRDNRNWIDESIDERNTRGFVPKIYSDYEYGKRTIEEYTSYPIVNDINEANFIFTHLRVTNFYDIPQYLRVNQFPYEGGFVRKDLLILTVRGYCYKDNGSVAPDWWLPSYDLSTEFHYFIDKLKSEHKSHRGDMEYVDYIGSNHWILKPAVGTRAVGHYILQDPRYRKKSNHYNNCNSSSTEDSSTKLLEEMIFEACLMSPKLSYSDVILEIISQEINRNHSYRERFSMDKIKSISLVDRIAQQLVSKPLLVRGLKFDLRAYVFVRSFEPFEAYMHRHHYARLANKTYNPEELDDNEVVLTVNAYNDDEEIASKQQRIFREDLKLELLHENPSLDYDAMMQTMITMFTELFYGASKSIGYWPASSAYYAVDIIFDISKGFTNDGILIPQAKLLEVNFMGDMEAAKLGSKNMEEYGEWVHDLIICLATKDIPHPDRHIRLG